MNYLTIAQVQEKFGLSAKQAKALFHVEDFPCLRIGHTRAENSVKLDYKKV